MTYIIGSTASDGWYLSGYKVIDDRITYTIWTPDRSKAATFSPADRDRLHLPFTGCWMRPADSFKPFETASEADETVKP